MALSGKQKLTSKFSKGQFHPLENLFGRLFNFKLKVGNVVRKYNSKFYVCKQQMIENFQVVGFERERIESDLPSGYNSMK